MLIQGKALKKIIKEEISRKIVEADGLDLAIARSKAAGAAGSDPMADFFDDVLAGKKVVTANKIGRAHV